MLFEVTYFKLLLMYFAVVKLFFIFPDCTGVVHGIRIWGKLKLLFVFFSPLSERVGVGVLTHRSVLFMWVMIHHIYLVGLAPSQTSDVCSYIASR